MGRLRCNTGLAQLYLAGQGINKQTKKVFSLMQKAAQKMLRAKN
ncbi:MAG: hypothetical protein AB8W37_10260 [Arsenophonus endosymbiont of Dermacentor nuttalli]